MYNINASVLFTVLLTCYVFLIGGKTEDLGDGKVGINLEAAQLDEEETHSQHMPSTLKCDGCRIIAFLLNEKFDHEHNKMKSVIKKKGRLGEADVLVIFESVCHNEFDKIGVKAVDGETRLSGPGLETKDVPGILQGGGRWPNRMRAMCELYAGDIGEDEIYSVYLNKKSLRKFLCEGTGLQGYCNLPKKKKLKKEETMKKEEL